MWRLGLGTVAVLLLLSGCGERTSTPSRPTTAEFTTATTRPITTTSSTGTPATRATTAPPDTTGSPTQGELLVETLTQLGDPDTVRVGLVAHRASVLGQERTIDIIDSAPTLELVRIFAPEHGLSGTADAGRSVADGVEALTGVPVRSLYGTRTTPEAEDLVDLDVVVYDLQDVGVRAYTYISTMGIIMDAAHMADVSFVVVDRANPQGQVVDGPLLAPGLESFISPYRLPTAYGLSSGELARLLVGEGMVQSDAVTVVGPAAQLSDTWVPPSPNLPTLESTWLYPAVVAFEATSLSVGRGTDEPFTVIGGPGVDVTAVLASTGSRRLLGLDLTPTTFTPRSIANMAESPRFEGQTLQGIKMSAGGPLSEPLRVTVELLDSFMDASPDRGGVITRPDVFDRLVGDPAVRQALLADLAPGEIAELWAADVDEFTTLSATYLMED